MEYKIYKEDLAIVQKISFAMKNFNLSFSPIILCIGSERVIADSLGPIVGSMLLKMKVPCFVYGYLGSAISAKELKNIEKVIRSAHPYSSIIVIDSATSKGDDWGYVKVATNGLYPGLGANKKLPKIGDFSIIGTVATEKNFLKNMTSCSSLGDVYLLAKSISLGIKDFFDNQNISLS